MKQNIIKGPGYRFIIISSCPEKWGGSEELWFGASLLLARAGHSVNIYKTNVDPEHPRIKSLRSAGCSVTDLYNLPALPTGWSEEKDWTLQTLDHALRTVQPHLTIVAQGNNFDGAHFADLCRRQNHRYVIIAQKAIDALFPLDHLRQLIQQAYASATYTFFVSQHNLELTRLQLALPLLNSNVISNPVNVPFENQGNEPFPDMGGPIRLACVARLNVFEKGQDLLLKVLATPRWRDRDVHVSFFGEGPQRLAIEELAHYLNITDRVQFAGHVSQPAAIWQTHHALILPSRSEGLPLVLAEAMLSGRPAIATNVGGINELLIDNVTGFLAATPSGHDLNEALERAWNRLEEWPIIGAQAAQHARARVPVDPINQFSDQLLNIVDKILPGQEQTTAINQPLVSVIIPTFNRAHLIERAIKSVRAQTYQNWQLIIVDDGSTDGTRELLASAKDIEYHYQENKGQGAARNTGLRHAAGTYIASLDSDDEWFPNFLADSVAILEKQNLDFVFSNYTSSSGHQDQYLFMGPTHQERYCTEKDGNWWLLSPEQSRRLMIETCPLTSSATVFRRSAMPPAWNETMKIADDWCLVLDIVMNAPTRTAFTLKPNWLKYTHDSNIYDSRDPEQVAQELGFHDENQILHRFRRQLTSSERSTIQRRIAMYHYLCSHINWKKSASITKATLHLGMAFKLAPAPVGLRFLKQVQAVFKRRLA